MKRSLGLVLMLLMLHLTWVRADAACARHGLREMHGMVMHDATMTGAPVPFSAAESRAPKAYAGSDKPCNAPATTPACCAATTSCGVTFDAQNASLSSIRLFDPGLMSPYRAVELSRAIAPATPPPRI